MILKLIITIKYIFIINMIYLNGGLNMKEYKAGIYLRLSKEHEEENNSIEAQREITSKYAIKKVTKYIKNI